MDLSLQAITTAVEDPRTCGLWPVACSPTWHGSTESELCYLCPEFLSYLQFNKQTWLLISICLAFLVESSHSFSSLWLCFVLLFGVVLSESVVIRRRTAGESTGPGPVSQLFQLTSQTREFAVFIGQEFVWTNC